METIYCKNVVFCNTLKNVGKFLAVTAMSSAISPAGHNGTSSITVTICVIITAVITSVMCMTSRLCTPFYCTDRTTGIHCFLPVMTVMAMSRDRHSQNSHKQHRSYNSCKLFTKMHGASLLSSSCSGGNLLMTKTLVEKPLRSSYHRHSIPQTKVINKTPHCSHPAFFSAIRVFTPQIPSGSLPV